MLETNKIYNEDCLDFMERLPPESIDLILTSPPYADMRDYVKISPEKYVEWFLPFAKKFLGVLKKNGVFVLNVRNNIENYKRNVYVYELVFKLVSELGFDLIEDIIWDKCKMLPNAKGKRPMDVWEFAFVFGKGTDITWNPDPVRTLYDEKSLRRFKTPVKKRWGTTRKEIGELKVEPHPLGCFPKNIIRISSESSKTGHPASFPVAFAEWFIRAFTNAGELVYDPFGGGGTTAVAAQKNGRKWILNEIHKEYIEQAEIRLNNTQEALF